jgi:putative membrane protein
MRREDRIPCLLLIAEALLLLLSLGLARDRLVWALEVFPILVGLPVLLLSYRPFRLTDLLYVLLAVHSVILMVGGIYTYAEVPFGFWMQEWFGFARNHYDRIGHFAQGFFPAILVREILLRLSPLRRGKLLAFLVLAVCLAVSASYELIEFGYTVAIGASAESFLGTQGDPWDAQWDMFLALIGAGVSLLTLSRPHDRSLSALGRP